MSEVAEAIVVDEWPSGDLYHSPRGLYEFQVEDIIKAYVGAQQGGGNLVVWDTGMGKTHFGMRMATLLEEDARAGVVDHDLTVLLCEKGKLKDWADDFATYTQLTTRIHHGPNRLKKLATEPLPDVLITTYETARTDLARKTKAKRGYTLSDGPLMTVLRKQRTTWIGDEFVKLRNRDSALYKAFEYTFRHLRRAHPKSHRVFGLTATPIERDWEDAFNQIRLIRPDLMPLVKEFEEAFVASRHPVYKTARYRPPVVMDLFVKMCAPVILRKRKTDPDVVAQFPRKVEEAMHVTMTDEHADVYEAIRSLADPDPENPDYEPPVALWTILRLAAAHPAALVKAADSGTSNLVRLIVDTFGRERLLAMPCAKEQRLIEYVDPLVKGQGAKVVIFTFFGQTVLPLLADALRSKGLKVYENHGGLSASEMAEIRNAFRTDAAPCVFLTSDAGARGLNLPEATYVVEYESALTYANRTQRLDRIHRIDSTSASVHCMTLILDESVEVAIAEKIITRNAQTDQLLDDEDAGEHFMTAAERKAALRLGRLNRRKKT